MPAQLCPTLWDPMGSSLLGSSVHCMFPRKNTGVGLPFLSPGDLPDPEIEPASLALVSRFFTIAPPGKLSKYNISVLL